MWLPGFPNIIHRASRAEGCIYLTFDDGPDARYTPQVLEILPAKQVRASFFLLGGAARKHPSLVRAIADAGHTIGCHGDSHVHPWCVSAQQARREVERGMRAIESVTGYNPALFRPAHGRLRPAMLRHAHKLGMNTVLWSRSAVDWGRWGNPEAIKRRLARVQGGDIVLLHDAVREKNRPEATVQVLEGFIDRCQRRGLRFDCLDNLARTPGGKPAYL